MRGGIPADGGKRPARAGLSRAALAVLLALAGPAFAAGGRRDIAGIGLGMTGEQIVQAARVTCRLNKAHDVSCVDPNDRSEYKALLSGGRPSVALSVKHTFCSAASQAAVLRGLLRDYDAPPGVVRPNPNGASFALAGGVEGNLNAIGGACAGGGRSYQFTLHDNALLQMGNEPAPDAAARP